MFFLSNIVWVDDLVKNFQGEYTLCVVIYFYLHFFGKKYVGGSCITPLPYVTPLLSFVH